LIAAADRAPAAEAVELRRRAAAELFRSGRAAAGLEVARGVLAAVGAPLPSTATRARAAQIYRRARLSLRGLDLEERADAPAPELTRVDAVWSSGRDLAPIDLVAASAIGARSLSLALESGDPARAARALATEAIAAAAEGPEGRARAAALVARATIAAER